MSEKINKFDYPKAVEELEKIAQTVEDPKTSLDDIDKYMKRSAELIALCREYLRSVRDKVENTTLITNSN